ncbi:MAG: hypothetical protein DWQ11_18830 [Proteobacteria bacterium]|nr:MAG: hypothetical protein DWQ11_18830 [Pseudomonadota bacterium]
MTEYDDLIAQAQQTDTAQRARVGFVTAADTNPDAYAEARRVARRTGVPVDTALNLPAEMQRQARVGEIDFGTLAQTAPATAALLADVDRAKLAHDNVENLSAIERMLRPVRSAAAGTTFDLSSGFYGLIETGLKGIAPLGDPLAGTILPENPLRRMAAGFEEWRKSQSAMADVVAGDQSDAGFVERSINSGFRSFGQMAPSMAATVFTGNPAFALGSAGALSGSQAATKALDTGLDPLQALSYGAQDATAEILTERLPLGRLLKDLKAGSPFYKLLARQFATEVPTEMAATAWQNFNEWANIDANRGKPFSDYIAELPEAEAQTVIATMTMVGLTAGMGKAVQVAADRGQRAQRAEEGAQFIEQMNTFAAADKLLARDADTFEQFIEQAAEGGPVEDVYLDAQLLNQSGIAEQLAAVSPSVAEQLPAAAATGGQVRIPVAEYAARVAGTEMAPQLLDHLRTEPEGFSRAEAREYMQTQGEQLQAEIDQHMARAEDSIAARVAADAVRNTIREQLDTAGRFTPQVNDAYATMVGSFYTTQAERLGLDAQDLYSRFPLSVGAQDVAGGAVLAQGKPPAASISGDEFGTAHEIADAPQMRKLAREWYDANLRGRSVTNAASGREIQFRGARKAFNTSASPEKIQLFAALEQLISNGEIVSSEPSTNPAQKNVKAYHWLEGDVRIGDRTVRAGVTIREDNEGNLYYNHNPVNEKGTQPVGPLTDPAHKAGGVEPKGESLEQSIAPADDGINLSILAQTARGTFNPDTLRITLLKDTDLSTFLHESGHAFLEMQFSIASSLRASGDELTAGEQQIVADTDALLAWFGVRDLSTWHALDFEEKRDYHERFARGFEAYLFEGRAPNLELAGLMQRFRAWLLRVYRDLKALNVELTDEVRGVMDRMLATDEAITLAEQARSMVPLLTSPETSGMTPEEFAAYQALGQDATADAQQDLAARGLRDMRWLANARGREIKRLQKEAAGLRKAAEMDARREIMSQPIYRAWQFLTGKLGETGQPAGRDEDGKFRTVEPEALLAGRLDAVATEWMLVGEPEMFAALKTRHMTGKDGLHPDVVAEMFGFTSGDELIRTLADANPPAVEIEALTDLRMLEQHGELASEDAIARAADAAIHNEARARFLATEANALAAATGRRKILMSAVREYARLAVARLRVRDVKPGQYTAAEARAGKAAETASRAGDLATAAAEKRNQLLNNAAAREALRVREEIEGSVKYLGKFGTEAGRKGIPADYLDQIDALTAALDLRRGQTLKAIDKRASLMEWVEAMRERGIEPDIDPQTVEAAARKSYKDMTVEEVRGLVDAVRQVEHLGKFKDKLLKAKDAREFAEIEAEIEASIREHGGDARPVEIEGQGEARRVLEGFLAGNRKLSSLVRQMDGGRENGPLYRTLVAAMNAQGTWEAVQNEKAAEALDALYKPILAMKGGVNGDVRFIPAAGVSLSRAGRLAVALNWGNETNRRRVLSSDFGNGPLAPAQIDAILGTLTREEWAFVQGVWDHIDSYWPQIADKQRRLLGTAPEKVEAVEFERQLADGSTLVLRGGYYPIKYDTSRDDKAAQHDAAAIADEMKRGAYTAATTRRGHTKARAEDVRRPLRLSLDVITEHIAQVNHDLAWHEWLIDANRILRSRKVGAAIRDHYGDAVLRTMRDTLKDIAAADLGAQTAVDRVLLYLRANVSRATMGFSLTTALLQPFGLTQSMARIGTTHVLRGMARWAGDTARFENTLGWIQERSEFMRLRNKTFNRELYEIRGKATGGKSRAQQIYDASLFMLMQKMQLVADVPTWLGAYEKALDGGMEEAEAVALADRAVIESQGGGQTKDLSEIQRKHPMLTMFYSYFSVTYNLMAESTARTEWKNPLAVAGWMSDMMLLAVIPALAPAIILALLRGEGGDDEDWPKKLAKWQASYLMGTLPMMREFSGTVDGYDYGGVPVGRAVGDVGKLATQVAQGEADEGLALAFVRMVGTLFGIPVTQAVRSWRGWKAWEDGDAPATSVLVGPPRRD